MVKTYSPFEMAKHINSDLDVLQHKIQAVSEQAPYKLRIRISVGILCMLLLCIPWIEYVYVKEAPATITIAMLVTVIMIVHILAKIDQKNTKYNAYIKNIVNATIPLADANLCTAMCNMLKNHPEFNHIKEGALAQGRQLYVFDMDMLQNLVDEKLDGQALQLKQDACKEIHNLNLA